MNAYLMYGPEDGRFIQVPSAWPPKLLRFPVPLDDTGPYVGPFVPGEVPMSEYHLDSILPLPRPLRGKLATYRYRSTTPVKETT